MKLPVNRCAWCKLKMPALFVVPDDVWEYYIPPERRNKIICLECWGYLTTMTDGGVYEDIHSGPALMNFFGKDSMIDSLIPLGYMKWISKQTGKLLDPAMSYMRGIARAPRVRCGAPAAVARFDKITKEPKP